MVFPEPADPCIIKGEFLGALIISFCSFCIVATTSFNLVPVLFSKLILRNSSINPSPSSSIYWYYLAKAQLLTKDLIGALKSINMNLSFQYPYPSKEKALILKENIEYSLRLNK